MKIKQEVLDSSVLYDNHFFSTLDLPFLKIHYARMIMRKILFHAHTPIQQMLLIFFDPNRDPAKMNLIYSKLRFSMPFLITAPAYSLWTIQDKHVESIFVI